MELSVKDVNGRLTLVVIDNNGEYHVVKNCTDLSLNYTATVMAEDGSIMLWRGSTEFQFIS